MAAKGKAKTASKNNPLTRQSAKVFAINGEAIQPVVVHFARKTSVISASGLTNVIQAVVAAFKSGKFVTDNDGNVMTWDAAKQIAKVS